MKKKFLLQLAIFSIPFVLIALLYIYSFSLGSFDFYYKKVSSPMQGSLIVGTSKAARDLVPSVFDQELIPLWKCPKMYNFAFTALYSPYGPAYYSSIIKKLDTTIKNGVFIITVDVSSVRADTENLEDEEDLREKNSFLANINCVTCDPNLEYILYGQETYYKKIFLNMVRGQGYLHNNGWLEVNSATDSATAEKGLQINIKQAEKTKYKLSAIRIKYLKKLVNKLKQYGLVVLVNLPEDTRLLKTQKQVPVQFDSVMTAVSAELKVPYRNFTNEAKDYKYSDGAHMNVESSYAISKNIAIWINTFHNNL